MATRAVSLRTEDGRLVNFTAGEEVRNLAQVRVGDRVVVSYEVGLVMALSPSSGSSINERREKLEAGRAELGQKPAGVIRETIEVIATVRAIDLKNRAVTLQGAKQTVTLPVAEDIKLDGIKVGDQVHAMYRESLAVRVEPAPAK
jgi:Cu/Ag efflux protein CusF